MEGIIFPERWREQASIFPIVPNGLRTIPISLEILEDLLAGYVRDAIAAFNGQDFALALSAGLDSSVLAVLISKLKRGFSGVTIADSEDHPDIFHSRLLAKKLGIKHHEIIIPREERGPNLYFNLFKAVSDSGFSCAICGDAIDEILGGYWPHQEPDDYQEMPLNAPKYLPREIRRTFVFNHFWQRLTADHLVHLDKYSRLFGVQVALPYLAAASPLSLIPLADRANDFERKIILRQLAAKIGIPDEIIQRKKLGLCNVFR